MKTRNSLLGCLVLLWLATTAFCADFHGKVTHVADGDTITVLTPTNRQVKIRLNGIDCPEKNQAYGHKTKEFTKGLVAVQTITIITFGERSVWPHDRGGDPGPCALALLFRGLSIGFD